MRRALIALSSLLGVIAMPGAATAADETTEAESCKGCEALLELAASNPSRKEDRARDKYRHPVETLSFFRVAPTMKVGEYAPGGEWYSRLLGLYLGQQGHLVGLYFNPEAPAFKPETREGIRKGAANYPADVAKFTGMPADKFAAYTLGAIPEGEKGTFDVIVVPRMMHNLLRWNIAGSEFAAMRDLLKPGGLIGIEQHRARPDAPADYADGSKGYLREADVIRFMKDNGFDLVAQSEISANPKDTANWPDGVWTLPPSLALKDKDRDKYLAIGESDRMTLLFRKRD
ncbi:putative methyltransferase [Novosphingobium sp. PhB57]|uniref:class I SAM-dependent methyltransferase n=1 Tax=unclassified Novosphingobium TaxID=2644732 RepID=UPI001052DB9D|nr:MULTISPECIES: class I SAM-dependent methyltransferase [unclassified Novosphingobium]TCU62154.1 putative methyltransferase [Novosphingobium sp. PhB57]TDW62804.1 putative methyltransferase [Novosphingobium sp. PhB55]